MQNNSSLVSFVIHDSNNVPYSLSQFYYLLRAKITTKKKRFVAYAGENSCIHIWDIEENRIVEKLQSSGSCINAMALLRGGSFASVSDDGTVRVWDLKTYTLVSTLTGHTEYVRCVIELPDGRIATGAHDRTVRVWDLKDKTHQILENHKGSVLSLALLNDDYFASCGGSGDGTINIWNLTTLDCTQSFSNQTSCYCLLKLQNGNLASGSVSDRNISIWDWTNGKLLSVLHSEEFIQEVWDVDNLSENQIVSCGEKSVLVWNVSAKKVVHKISDQLCRSVKRLDENRVVGSQNNLSKQVMCWNSNTGQLEKSLDIHFSVWCTLVL
jgi:WD40 repeat protein